MAYETVGVARFKGLNVVTDPGDVGLGAAVAGDNFDLAADLSYVRSRDGLVRLGAVGALTGATCYRLLRNPDPAWDELIAVSESLAGTTVYLDSISTTGVVSARGNWGVASGGRFHDLLPFNNAGVYEVYASTRSELLRKYTVGGAVASSVGRPKFLAVTATNRLVQAHYTSPTYTPSGANGNTSCVFFSDPAAPETFTATNFVHLRPGDGEEIRGMASYKGQLFVFKQTAMFVFSGESIDATGEPVFDYRTVDLPGEIGDVVSNRVGPMVGVGLLGVYYLARDGVYRTTGGPPVKVSGALEELFRLDDILPHTLSCADGRVLVAEEGTLYVLDERSGEWLRWTMPQYDDSFYCPFITWERLATGGGAELTYVAGDTTLYLGHDATTDDGQAIASSYQTGFGDLGGPGLKVVAQSQVRGSGTVTYAMATDYGAADAGTSLALGAAPAVADRIERKSRRGRNFAIKLSAASGAWRVNDVALYIAARYPAGVKV